MSNNILVSDEEGVRYLRFGSEWIQGGVRIDNPEFIEIEYVQQMMMWMLFNQQPQNICQLGLGVGSLTRFCHLHFPKATTTAVEIDPLVIDACHKHFFLPKNSPNLKLINQDAMDFVLDKNNRSSQDVLQVDLYDAIANGPTLSSQSFYNACARTLTKNGIMTINIFCDYPEHYEHLYRIEKAFRSIAWLPVVHDSNIVAIAFKGDMIIDFDDLYQRAAEIEQTTGLPANTWVDGLYKWMDYQ